MTLLNRHRVWQAVVDAGFIALAWFLAFQLRFDGAVPPHYERLFEKTVLVVLAIKLAVFVLAGLYNHWWRYVSVRDMWSVVRGVAIAALLVAFAVYAWSPVEGFRLPRSIVVLDSLILLALVAGSRLLARTLIERPGARGIVARGREAIIVGAGDAGQLIIREMLRNPELGYTPIGLVDDDVRKRNMRLHGVRVLGPTRDLRHLLRGNTPDEVIIALPSAAGETRQRIVNVCRDAGIPVKTLPAVHELIAGNVNLARQLREVEVEDVLGREAIELDVAAIASYVSGEAVLVTGAGGSIGSELCRQIAALGPKSLILVENAESPLVDIQRELTHERGFSAAVTILADVKDRTKMRHVFDRYTPGVVFHASAYKHVPLTEANPVEAIRNNVLATNVIAELASEHGTKRFVLISTDLSLIHISEPTRPY